MKFKSYQIIYGVKSFKINDLGGLLYIKEDILYDKNNSILFDSKQEITNLNSSGKWITFNHTLDNPVGYYGKKKDFQVLKGKIIKAICNNCIYYGDKLSTSKLAIEENLRQIWSVQLRMIFFKISKNYLIYTKDDLNIEFYDDKEELILLWQYDLGTKYNWQQKADYIDEPDLEKQAEVIKFLGVYKNELWLVLNSGALLALNIETGAESRYIKEGKMIVGESDFEDFKGYFGYDTVLDEKNGLIFNLNRHFYVEYNLNSDNDYFDSYSFKESSLKNQLNLNYIGGFDEEYIYSYEGSDNNRFAIFSRDKKEIIWSSEIEEVKGKFPAIRDLQYGAGKIYVLDYNNTLHIFEKE